MLRTLAFLIVATFATTASAQSYRSAYSDRLMAQHQATVARWNYGVRAYQANYGRPYFPTHPAYVIPPPPRPLVWRGVTYPYYWTARPYGFRTRLLVIRTPTGPVRYWVPF